MSTKTALNDRAIVLVTKSLDLNIAGGKNYAPRFIYASANALHVMGLRETSYTVEDTLAFVINGYPEEWVDMFAQAGYTIENDIIVRIKALKQQFTLQYLPNMQKEWIRQALSLEFTEEEKNHADAITYSVLWSMTVMGFSIGGDISVYNGDGEALREIGRKLFPEIGFTIEGNTLVKIPGYGRASDN
jgi:hypothetical protein